MDLREGRTQTRGLAGEVTSGVLRTLLGICEERANAGDGQLESVGCRRQELLQHRRLQQLPLDLDLHPAVQLCDVFGAAACEFLMDLDVGVRSGAHLAEQLHDRGVIEPRRRVRLLTGHR